MSPLYTTLSRAPFSPSRLFRAMVQGLWYDPSDLTAEKITWRRNLFTYSEQFDNAAWSKASVSVTANAAIAPDGTLTADLIAETAVNSQHYVLQNVAPGVNSINVTFHLKPNGRTKVRIRSEQPQANGLSSAFDLTGSGSVISGSGTITALANGWYRCTAVSSTTGTGASGYHLVQSLDSGGLDSYLGDGVSGFYVWGAHLERGASFTGYQKITDFNSDFLAAYPYHTLFQDAAGTTPVTALGQPCGLVLDKRLGLVLGAEILTNGDFSAGSTGWTNPDSAPSITTFSGGAATMTAAAGGTLARLRQSKTLTAGTYLVSVNVVSVTGTPSDGALSIGNSISGDSTYGTIDCRTVGLKTKLVHISGPTLGLAFTAASTSGAVTVIDNVSVKLLPGNHAFQTSAPSRPTVEARVNLCTKSEFPGGTADSSTKGGLIAGVSLPNWLGRFTTGISFGHDGSTSSYVYMGSALASAQHTFSVFVKMDDGNAPSFGSATANNVANDFVLIISGSGVSPLTYAVTSVGDGVYRVSTTVTAGTINLINNGVLKYGTNSSRTFKVTGYQLELGATATTYQRVNTATYYADVGAPRYLQFDGTDDGMVTNSINFTGTDKMTVWAGVRKLSDALSMIFELSVDFGSNNGSFGLYYASDFRFGSKGSTAASVATSASAPAPVTKTLVGAGSIADDRSTIYINGPQAGQSVSDQGTGNYGNYPLYIGRRGGTSLPFNGRLYGLIIRGAASNADQIVTTESWMNSKTRAY